MVGPSHDQERRKHPRIPVRLPLDYWEEPNTLQGGLVADISEGGLCVHSIHRIEIGVQLRIRVYISRDEYRLDCIQGSGKVIWRSLHRDGEWRGYKYGLYLTAMALDDRQWIRQLLKESPVTGEEVLDKVSAAGAVAYKNPSAFGQNHGSSFPSTNS